MRLRAALIGSVLLSAVLVPAGASAAAAPSATRTPLDTTGTLTDPGAPAIPASVTAPSFVVADLNTGDVVAARDPHHRYLPASCLKLLTSLVVLPRVDPAQIVTARRSDAQVDGTRVGIVPGGRYTVDALFHALLMRSGNDAAELLARTGATRAQTVDAMNREAARLGAADTHAVTPSGLDGPGQSTSAYDLALIDRQAMTMPAFRRYIGTRRSTFGAIGTQPFEIDTENRLLLDDVPGALGGKDGYTDAARHTFVGNVARNGHTYVATIMSADRTAGKQAETLLTWAFALPSDAGSVGTLTPARPATGDAPNSSTTRTGAARDSASTQKAPAPVGATRTVLPVIGMVMLLLVLAVVGLRIRAVRRVRARRRPRLDRMPPAHRATRTRTRTEGQRPARPIRS